MFFVDPPPKASIHLGSWVAKPFSLNSETIVLCGRTPGDLRISLLSWI